MTPPPIGVMPLHLWRELHPSPSLADYLARYKAVHAAVERYRAAGVVASAMWLAELWGEA